MNVKRKTSLFRDNEHCQNYIYIYSIVMFSALTVWIIQQIVRVVVLKESFFSNPLFGADELDYYMDYFNVNYFWFFPNGNPYTSDAMSSYPPLALLIARFFACFGEYELGPKAVRETAMGMISYYVMFFVFTTLSVLSLLHSGKKRGFSYKKTGIIALALVVSLPYIFLFERGNYWILSITAVSWFYAWYDSDKKWQREAALILLAIAAGIKMYPALLAAILLKERRFWDFMKTVLYTLLLFFLPFLCFSGGFANLTVFLHNLLDFQSYGQVSKDNYSMATFFFYFVEITHGCRLSEVPDWVLHVGSLSSYAMLVIGLVVSLFSDKKWKSFALITFAVIFFPAPSYVYSSCMLLPIAAMFLLTPNKNKKDFVYLILLLLMFIPVQFGYLVADDIFFRGLTVSNFLQHMAMMVLFWLLIYDSAKNGLLMLRAWRHRRQYGVSDSAAVEG